jgi:hypothetical protein
VSEGAHLVQVPPGEKIFHVKVAASQTLAEIDKAAFAVYSKGFPTVDGKGR